MNLSKNFWLLFCVAALSALLIRPNAMAQGSTTKTSTITTKPAAPKPKPTSKLKFYILKDSVFEYWKCIAGPQTMADRFKNVSLDTEGYFYGETGYPQETYKLVNNVWEIAGQHNRLLRIEYEPSARATNIYGNSWKILSSHEGGEWYYTKYIGDKWKAITYPRDVERDAEIIPICDTEGNLYQLAPEKYSSAFKLYKHEDEQWVALGKVFPDRFVDGEHKLTMLSGQHGNWLLIVGNTLFSITNYMYVDKSKYPAKMINTIKVFEYTGGTWKSKIMEVADIPRSFKTTTALERFEKYWTRSCYRYNGDRSSFVNFYLFRENDKLGLQDNEGHVVAEPLFDGICMKDTPERLLLRNELGALLDSTQRYCYELIQGKDTIYVKLSSYLPAQGILDGFGTQPGTACGHCNGKGYTEERIEKKKVRGEWVDAVTITTQGLSTTETHYNISKGGMQNVTKTPSPSTTVISKGYYKEEIQTVVIPRAKCGYCNGHPVKTNREIFEYDAGNKVYVKNWK